MKELTIEEKAQRYDEALEYAKSALDCLADDYICNHLTKDDIKGMYAKLFPELKESEDEKVRNKLIEFFKGYSPDEEWWGNITQEDILAWLEKQGEQNFDTDFSDLRTWKYIVDAVWTEKEGIGQYLDSPFTEEVAKKLQIRFGNTEQILANSAKTCKDEQKPAKWHREDEQNLNACLSYIPDEFLRRWLTDIIHVKYDKSVELPKGEDYGIDGLYAAIDILKKTLGKVDGYQSDDGILEHKCAITAVKKLYEQNPWSEEDETRLTNIIIMLKEGASRHFIKDDITKAVDWLKSLKDRYTWKPSEEHFELEEFAKIVRGNLTGISKVVQKLFEAKYLQLTGKKMYGGFKD